MKPLWVFGAGVLCAAGCGLAISAGVPVSTSARAGAQLGILLSGLAGLLTLLVDGRALKRSVSAALALSIALFFLRLAVWGVGFRWAKAAGTDGFAFTVGFFALYAVLLWVEVGFLLTASRQLPRRATA